MRIVEGRCEGRAARMVQRGDAVIGLACFHLRLAERRVQQCQSSCCFCQLVENLLGVHRPVVGHQGQRFAVARARSLLFLVSLVA